jgi:hypothetical protein
VLEVQQIGQFGRCFFAFLRGHDQDKNHRADGTEETQLDCKVAPLILQFSRCRNHSQKRGLWLAAPFLAALLVGLEALEIPNIIKGTMLSPTGVRSDALGIMVSLMMGAAFDRMHIASEGVQQLRNEAELKLAHHLQTVLVPPVKC